MKCSEAKLFLRPSAIEHYITEGKTSIYRFMSLWSDEEPYPISELVEIQKQVTGEIKADYNQAPSEQLERALKRAENLLTRIQHKERELMNGNSKYRAELSQIKNVE
ncbi:hypothetical protein [Lonepinella sp. BR2474]|uniref:hypothetical protein n=1 Tax=Lonepinella sp. BR2474 TaxID=3434548 RepID=UPI003F6DD982